MNTTVRQVVLNFVVQVKHFLQERLVLGNRHSFLLRCLGVCHQLLGRCLPHERASLSVATQRLSISLRSRKKASNALVVLTVASGEADDMLQLGVGDALRRALVSVCVTSLFFLVRASS